MSDDQRTFGGDFKRFFLRGLAVLLPTVLTLWIVSTAYKFIDNNIAEPINRGVRLLLNHTVSYHEPLRQYFDPSEEELNATVAERAVARGIANRDDARRELREREELDTDPSAAMVNAFIAGQSRVQEEIDRTAIRMGMRRENIRVWWLSRWYMNLIGLVIAIVSVYIAGRLLGGFFGRRIYQRMEQFLTAIPVIKQVYPHVKQVVDFIFNDERQIEFNRVVVVQYPRKGIWSIGFVTGNTMKNIARESGDAITVFIPSSPTPFTGYTITIPRKEAIDLPISVDEALRFTITGGVLIPEHQTIRDGASAGKELDSAEGEDGQRGGPTGMIPLTQPPTPEATDPDDAAEERNTKDDDRSTSQEEKDS